MDKEAVLIVVVIALMLVLSASPPLLWVLACFSTIENAEVRWNKHE